MKKLRMLVAATLSLCGAGTLAAQTPTPPTPGLYPSSPTPGPYPAAPLPGTYPTAPVAEPAAGAPAVVVGDNASPNAPKLWISWGIGAQWVTPSPNPSPLLTTSTVPDAGIIGAPSTVLLLGQQTVSYGTFATFNFGMGGWWNEDRTIGSDGMTTWSEQRSASAFFASDLTGTPALFRPIIDANALAESSVPVALPGQIIGSFLFESRMKVNNGDSNLLLNAYRDESRAWTGLIGYRLMYIREEMRMVETQIALADNVLQLNGTPLLAGDTLEISDRIETVNRLYLGQVGIRWDRFWDRASFTATAKLGFGWNDERIYADGRTQQLPGFPAVAGGVLVQQSFPYRNYHAAFAFVPEVGVAGRIRIGRRLHLVGRYNALWVSDVARPGKYFDRVIETTQMPTSPTFTGVVGSRPTFIDNQTSNMFIHGVTVGLTWAY
jgi:hypothetical protein